VTALEHLGTPGDNSSAAGRTAIIIGAGPAGLTAAYELVHRTNLRPVVFEMSDQVGGIARTVNYKGNRIDIGGHRFFSKSRRVMDWWQNLMPLQGAPARDELLLANAAQGIQRQIALAPNGPDPEKTDLVMLIRNRLSRIFFLRKFFSYPVALNMNTVVNLGPIRIAGIGLSYLKARLLPIRPEKSLGDFFINRFGRQLYLTFFKSYTEKVWGVPCREITAEWGAQRIKGLSISRAVAHALRRVFTKDSSVEQKATETSLIETFLYPKYGPGQMWEETARIVSQKGGEVHLGQKVVGLGHNGTRITEVAVQDVRTGEIANHRGDYFFSTMPVQELISGLGEAVPPQVLQVARGLVYRDFITVGLLLTRLKIRNQTDISTVNNLVPDNWIYIQERDVKVGRLQIFNNWSPYMVKDPNTVWIGLEYFVNQGDELWSLSDQAMAELAADELARLGIIDQADVLDAVVIRMPKTYPAYFGSYPNFSTIQEFTDRFENLFLIGRNGMHRYNNQDHSMLTAMTAVDNLVNGVTTKDNIWNVNVEQEYHEEASSE